MLLEDRLSDHLVPREDSVGGRRTMDAELSERTRHYKICKIPIVFESMSSEEDARDSFAE